MKKIIMMVLVGCTCLLVAQDIAGTYRATGQRVEYQFFTRPNGLNADFSTSLVINDAYGLGIQQEVANIPAGYNFVDNIVKSLRVSIYNFMEKNFITISKSFNFSLFHSFY